MRNDPASATPSSIEGAWAQEGFRVRMEWGRRGATSAAARGDVLVIVDVLSFSTCVATAIERDALIRPCADQAEAERAAAEHGGVAAVHRSRVPREGRFSLSPLTYLEAEPGKVIALASPNGATCSRLASEVADLFVGALVNASAVGRAAAEAARRSGVGLTVIAAGERWEEPSDEGVLRFAVEDYLGAGAILAAIDLEKSPEARICEETFRAARMRIAEMIHDCASGRELRIKGYGDDVSHAARLDLYASVPRMTRGELRRG